MTRLTTRCIALAMAVLLLTGATALAASYAGKGRDDPKLGISFEKTRGKIKRFTIDNARFFCGNDTWFRADMRAGRMALNQRNRFAGRFTDEDGKVVLRVGGKVIGRRARGSLRIVAFVKSYKCTTRRVSWRARRLPGG